VFTITKTSLASVVVIEPPRFGDARGFFSEVWNQKALSEQGIDLAFVQDNQSLSAQHHTVRGLHFQVPPHAQDKLVRCGRGRLLDVAVDIRTGSPSFGNWVAVELSAENGKQLLVPKGFMHGFATLEPNTEILYKCTDYYAPDCDRSIRFDDPTLDIDWGLGDSAPILSAKDENAPLWGDFVSPFTY